MQILEHDEEGWYDEEQGNGTDAHTADDTKGEGTVTISDADAPYKPRRLLQRWSYPAHGARWRTR